MEMSLRQQRLDDYAAPAIVWYIYTRALKIKSPRDKSHPSRWHKYTPVTQTDVLDTLRIAADPWIYVVHSQYVLCTKGGGPRGTTKEIISCAPLGRIPVGGSAMTHLLSSPQRHVGLILGLDVRYIGNQEAGMPPSFASGAPRG